MCDYTYNYAYLYVNVYVYDYVLIIKREVFILNIKRTFAAVSAAVMLCTSGNGAAALEMQDLFEGYSAEQSEAAQTLNKMAASTIMPVCTDNTEGKLRPISFIRMVSDGYMRIVADTEAKKVTIEYYTADFTLKSSKEIAFELDYWGGFYEGSSAYYLIEGQANEEESDSKEVIRIIKYDKNWNRLGAISITPDPKFGGDVRYPFDYGCVEAVEIGNMLYIVTAHQGYVDPAVGMGHQGFLMIEADTASMTGSIGECDLWHSFAQYIQNDENNMYIHEQSEGSRYAKISRYNAESAEYESIPVFRYGGDRTSAWAVSCYATVDGIALSSKNIIGLGTSIDQSNYDNYDSSADPYNIYVTVTPKDDFTEAATVTKIVTSNTDPNKRYKNVPYIP